MNNSPLNFGSIQILKNNTNGKSLSGLAKNELVKFQVIISGSANITQARTKIKPKQIDILANKDSFLLVGKTLEDEIFALKQIKKNFRPNAKFIADI